MPTTRPTDAEAEIRVVLDGWVEAFRRKDAALFLSLHAPEIVSFDIVPPLRYRGAQEYAVPTRTAFAMFDGPIVMDLSDVVITARDGIAFSRSLNHFQATRSDGGRSDYWFRWTACFERRDGRWLIVHDHTSLPTDFATGRSVSTLEP